MTNETSPTLVAAPGEAAPTTEAELRRREEVRRFLEETRRGGDSAELFLALFNTYYRPLLGFFRRKGFAPEDSLDLTQETFVGIYRGLKGLRDEDRFEAWMFRIATSTYLKRLRSSSTTKRSGTEVPLGDLPSPGSAPQPGGEQLEVVLEEERRRVVRGAIRKLPDQMRKCLTLRIYHELSYAEIAVVMRVKIDTVKAHLFQARKKLEDELRGYSLRVLDSVTSRNHS